MLIRHLALPLALVACLDAPEPEFSLGEHRDDMICAPLCGGGYQPELQGAYSYGYALFAGARSTDANCADIGTSAPRWDCVVTFVSAENPCGTYTVECLDQGAGQAPHCNWSNPYNCP